MNFHEDFVIKSSPTGSNYTCNPPVTNTDIDTVFLVRQAITVPGIGTTAYIATLLEAGWEQCVGEGYEVLGGDFTAWRKGNKNYICTTDPVYYAKYVKATKICKMLNLLNKQDRVFMFKLVMEGAGLPSNQPVLTAANGAIGYWHPVPVAYNPCAEIPL